MRPVLAPLVLATLLGSLPLSAYAQGTPGVEPNKCVAGKTTCVTKKIAGLLKCRELCQKKPDKKCGQAQAECEAKVMAKFDGGDKPEKGCFAKLEAKADPAKPESVCVNNGDTALMEAHLDAVVAELIALLEFQHPPFCGDRIVNGGEACDGTALGGATCESIGGTGELGCTASCEFDVSGCTFACPSECAVALTQAATHDMLAVDHLPERLSCNVEEVEWTSTGDHDDWIRIRNNRCDVCLGECEDADALVSGLTDIEEASCAALAALTVEALSGQTCDVSSPAS